MAASIVIIEEQSGPRRRVELVGGGLPIQGANWSGLQLLATAFNPGNPQGTQHVLGPQEVPSNWDFVWNTTRLIRSPISVTEGAGKEFVIVQASVLADLLEDIFRGGALLKVTWISKANEAEASSYRKTRIGRVGTWDFKVTRVDDVDGTVSFIWLGRDLAKPQVSKNRGNDLVASLQAAIAACNSVSETIAKNRIRSASPEMPNTATRFTLGQLETFVNGPLKMVDDFARFANGVSNRLKQLGGIIQDLREMPAAILGRIVDIANNAVSVANQFCDEISREGPETQSTRMKISVLSRNATYFSTAQTQAAYMASVMEQVADIARRRRAAHTSSAGASRGQDQMRAEDMFKTHLPKTGETMHSISKLYYQTPDLADELSIANGLPGYTITPPRIALIIPTRRNLEEMNRNRV